MVYVYNFIKIFQKFEIADVIKKIYYSNMIIDG